MLERARELRRTQTDAETVMWRLIRNRQLGAKFRRQHPLETYVLDFYCPELRLAIEVDGDQHAEACHRARDDARSLALAKHSISVARFSNREVLQETGTVVEALWLACQQRLDAGPDRR
ncbi:MAG: DUF559 domain-containing protein [Chloroflexi bacterium]|nr:DUF559 domain-containing protein [Chloroflexota bacterium]MCY3937650.1 DUF559 domain-containing protein [Chloroflexota bacterium]